MGGVNSIRGFIKTQFITFYLKKSKNNKSNKILLLADMKNTHVTDIFKLISWCTLTAHWCSSNAARVAPFWKCKAGRSRDEGNLKVGCKVYKPIHRILADCLWLKNGFRLLILPGFWFSEYEEFRRSTACFIPPLLLLSQNLPADPGQHGFQSRARARFRDPCLSRSPWQVKLDSEQSRVSGVSLLFNRHCPAWRRWWVCPSVMINLRRLASKLGYAQDACVSHWQYESGHFAQ